MKSLTSKILICFAVWLVFAGLSVVIGLKLTDWLTYRKLSNGVDVYGTVTAKEPQNHQIVRYSYLAGQQAYSGVGHGGRGNPSFGELNVGDRVIVFYDAANPSLSSLGYPQSHQKVEAAGILFLVIFLPLIPVAITIVLMIAISKSRSLYNKAFQLTAR